MTGDKRHYTYLFSRSFAMKQRIYIDKANIHIILKNLIFGILIDF